MTASRGLVQARHFRASLMKRGAAAPGFRSRSIRATRLQASLRQRGCCQCRPGQRQLHAKL